MNNIEILEELINGAKEFNQYNGNKYYKAIENLIKENKELKEIRDSLLWQKNFDTKILDEDYIPKSKVKEKIEELKKEEKQELKGLKGQDRYFIKQIYQAKRIVLEELLEEGE